MKKLSIKKIIEFKNKSDRSKKYFATALKLDKAKVETESSGGGDYWITSLSAISNSFRTDGLESIINKKDELEEKYGKTEIKKIKTMYERNIDILYNYEDFDMTNWKPSLKITFLKKHKNDFVLNIKGLQIQTKPHHVFTFQNGDVKEIGAIWFIGQLNGFKKDELGMFADILYRYLKIHFSKDYILNSKYCIAVDVFNKFEINYSQLEKREISFKLDSTLEELKELL